MRHKRHMNAFLSWLLAVMMVIMNITPAFAEQEGKTQEYGSLTVIVQDADTKEKISGNGITLTGNNYEQNGFTNDKGEVLFEDIPIGSYSVLDSEPVEGWQVLSKKNVEIEADTSLKLVMEKKKITKKVTLKVEAVDSEDKEVKISGINFDLYDSGNNFIKNITTGANGSVTVKDMDEGTYSLVQTSTTGEYLLDEEPTEFTLEIPGDYTNYQITVQIPLYKENQSGGNEDKTGTAAIVIKTKSGSPIVNAGFTLYTKTGTKVDEYFTDTKGEIEVADLEQQDYYFMLTTLPENIIFDTSKKFEFSLAYPNLKHTITITADVEDDITSGKITVVVKDQNDNSFIDNVGLELKDSNGISHGILTTGTDGTVVYENLPFGEYSLKETSVPDGYFLSTKTNNVTISRETASVTVTIQKQKLENVSGTLNVKVVDQKDSNKSIINALLSIYKEDGTFIAEKETGEDGTFTVTELEKGNYYIKEKTMPTGYQVEAEKKYDFRITETILTANITINKLSDADISNSGQLNVLVVDMADTSKPVVGATLTLLKDGNIFGTYKTSSEGKFSVKNIPIGEYYLSESTMPYGYTISKNKTKITFTAEKPIFNLTLHKIYSDPEESGGSGGDGSGGGEEGDEKKTGSINVTVIDKTSREKLTGAVIEFKNESDELVKTVTTTSDGLASATDLPIGKYYFIEKSMPDGYTVSTEKHKVDLSKFNTYNISLEKVKNGSSGGGDEQNKKGMLTVTVKDSKTNILLPGVSLELHKETGETISSKTTDGTGSVTFETGLGNYYFIETAVPYGYTVNTDKRTVSLSESVPYFEVTILKTSSGNEGTIGNNGKITVQVVDQKNAVKISNAVLGLHKMNGQKVGSYTTDSNGKIVIENLSLESYYLVEEKMPEGYLVSDGKYTIPLSKEIITYTFTLQKYKQPEPQPEPEISNGTFIINAMDKNNNATKLGGAKFGLFKSDGTKIGTYTTDGNGNITVKELPFGSYYALEEAMPSRYAVGNAKYEFTLDKNCITYTLTVEKTKTSSGGSGGGGGGGGSSSGSSGSSGSSSTTKGGPGSKGNGPGNNGAVSDGTWIMASDGRWWYQYKNSGYPINRWEYINNNGETAWYCFDNDGYMMTGWAHDGIDWYLLNPADGALVENQWFFDGTSWYYLGNGGKMQTGWIYVDNNWFYLNPANGGQQGAMQTGWITVDGKYYYLNPVSDGTRGALFVNTMTPDGYYVNASGERQ